MICTDARARREGLGGQLDAPGGQLREGLRLDMDIWVLFALAPESSPLLRVELDCGLVAKRCMASRGCLLLRDGGAAIFLSPESDVA